MFLAGRAEVDLLVQRAASIASAEYAADRGNGHVARICEEIERLVSRSAQRTFQVAVLALVKSGKSTLINAFLGQELLPTSNVPETARIVRVRHLPGEAEPCLKVDGKPVARGQAEIRAHLQRSNADARRSGVAPAGDLVLEAPMAALRGQRLDGEAFELLDTPGPNEAGSDLLRAEVDRLLAEADVILYLLDYTKLRTQEEHGLFQRLAELRPELLNRLSDRLFFAVNKMDLANSKGLSPSETRRYVAALLREQVPGLRVRPGRVLLLSAEQALLARLVQSGRAEQGAVRDFMRLCFGLRGTQKPLEECRRHAAGVLNDSGLVEAEEQVVSFIYEHRGRIFLQSVLDDLDRHLSSLDNHLRTASRALRLEHRQLAERVQTLEADLDEDRRAFQQIDALTLEAADRIARWAGQRFTDFRGELESELARSCEGGEARAGPDSPRSPRRSAAWRHVDDIFPDEPGRNDWREIADEGLARQRVADAHRIVATVLKAEFAAFRSDLELGAWERQRELWAEIEAQLAPLAARIGEAVGCQLEIDLRTVRLRFPAPSFGDLQDDIDRQIARFVERRTTTRSRQERRSVRTRRGGWCSDDEYRHELVEKVDQVSVFGFSRQGLVDSWRGWIRERTEISVETAGAIIRERVGQAVEQAREQLDQHREGYLRVVRQALTESQRGEGERRRRLEAVEAARGHLEELHDRVGRCREFVTPEEQR